MSCVWYMCLKHSYKYHSCSSHCAWNILQLVNLYCYILLMINSPTHSYVCLCLFRKNPLVWSTYIRSMGRMPVTTAHACHWGTSCLSSITARMYIAIAQRTAIHDEYIASHMTVNFLPLQCKVHQCCQLQRCHTRPLPPGTLHLQVHSRH